MRFRKQNDSMRSYEFAEDYRKNDAIRHGADGAGKSGGSENLYGSLFPVPLCQWHGAGGIIIPCVVNVGMQEMVRDAGHMRRLSGKMIHQ